jgi:hypothetical protein
MRVCVSVTLIRTLPVLCYISISAGISTALKKFFVVFFSPPRFPFESLRVLPNQSSQLFFFFLGNCEFRLTHNVDLSE